MTPRYPRRISKEEQLENIIFYDDFERFQTAYINKTIGFGVFTKCRITIGQPLLLYRGGHVPKLEAEDRRLNYEREGFPCCFIYDYQHMGKAMAVDATKVEGLGKLVNDSPKPFANAAMKKVVVNNQPHLVLYSIQDIDAETELRYNYGLSELSWRLSDEYLRPLLLKEVVDSKEIPEINETMDETLRVDDSGFGPFEAVLQVQVDENPLQLLSRDMEIDASPNKKNNMVQVDENPLQLISQEMEIDASTNNVVQVDENPLQLISREMEIDASTNNVAQFNPLQLLSREMKHNTSSPNVKVNMIRNTSSPNVKNYNEEGVQIKCEVFKENKNKVTPMVVKQTHVLEEGDKLDFSIENRSCNGVTTIEPDDLFTFKDEGEKTSALTGSTPKRWSPFKIDQLIKKFKIELEEIYQGKISNNFHDLYYKEDKLLQDQLKSCVELCVNKVSEETCSTIFRSLQSFLCLINKSNQEVNKYISMVLLPHIIEIMEKEENIIKPNRKRKYPCEVLPQSQEINLSLVDARIDDNNSINDSGIEHSITYDSAESSCEEDCDSDGDSDYRPDFSDVEDDNFSEVVADILEKSFNDLDDLNESISFPIIEEKINVHYLECNEVNDIELNQVHNAEKTNDNHLKHCCFCKKKVDNKITRHFTRKHKGEAEVKEACGLPVKSKTRARIWKVLVRKGDHEHNLNCLKDNKENLVVVRKRGLNKKQDYVPCCYCKGFFTSTHISQHESTCFKKVDDDVKKCSLKTSRAYLAASVSDGKYQNVHTLVLATMRDCCEKDIIKKDEMLLLLGFVLLQKTSVERISDIRYALKTLARTLLKFRERDGKADATAIDLVYPENFEAVIDTAMKMTGFTGPREIRDPNVFTLIGYILKSMSLCVRGQALKEGTDFLLEKVRRFIELYETEWRIHANNAKASYDERKENIPEKLPEESDVKIFRQYCIEEIKRLVEKHSEEKFNPWDYRLLSKVCLARALTFNARRGGEVSKLKLVQWVGVEDGRWKRNAEIDQLTDPVEKTLAERLQICYVPGKKKKGKSSLVPILFTEEMMAGIKIVVKERNIAGIPSTNPFVFATAGESRLKGWDTLQAITKRIEYLQHAELITPTRTRKFLSTLLQLLDMSDGELTWVTNHMGHSKNTHFAWYRKESSTIELTKMARVLSAVDKGKSIKNKKIDNLGDSGDESSSDLPNLQVVDRPETATNNAPRAADSTNEDDSASVVIAEGHTAGPPVAKKAKGWSRWSQKEEKDVAMAFAVYLKIKENPSMVNVMKVLEHHPRLKARGGKKVRDKIVNMIRQRR